MGIFSKPKKLEELTLVFDIGSSSVGGALFLMQSSGIPKIICSIREPIIFEKKINFDRFLVLTSRALSVVAGKIYKKGLGAPQSIFCVLSSPWYASQVRTIKLEKNAPFIFNQKLADDLIQKEIASFEAEHLNKNSEEIKSRLRLIEQKNTKTILNGYKTENPFNKKAKEIEMSLFVSMSPEYILKDFEDAILKHFHFKNIKFSSFAMASFIVARDIFAHQDNFLLVDIGGEVTDISMIKNNALRESISFPIGPNYIIRGMASELRCTLAEAKSFFSFYKDGHADDPTALKLDPIMNKLKTSWLGKFQESLASLSNDISIPSIIFVAVDKDYANFFSEAAKNEQFNQYILTESKFQIVFLDTGVFHGAAIFEDDTVRDSFIVIEAIYLNRFFVNE